MLHSALETTLIPTADSLLSEDRLLHYKNAAVLTLHHSLEFLDVYKIDYHDWLAKLLNLQHNENVYGHLEREV